MRIALVTPFAWGAPSAVNDHVALLARELSVRGHQPVVVASSDDPGELARMRRLTRRKDDLGLRLLHDWASGTAPDPRLLPSADGPLGPDTGIPVYPLGRSLTIRANRSVANLGLPVDVMARLEHLLAHGSFAVVHVHEPLAPSLSFTAIREARSPVIATFHLTPAGLRGYELGQNLLPRFYERLDGRIVTSPGAAAVLDAAFPGDYQSISPGSELVRSAPSSLTVTGAPPASGADPDSRVRGGGGSLLYVYRGDDRRALRALFRSLAAAPPRRMGRLVVAVHSGSADRWPPRPAPRGLARRVEWRRFEGPEELAALYAEADGVVLPFLGGEWLVPGAVDALVCGVPLCAPDFPLTRDALPDAPESLLFSPTREVTVARALDGLLALPRVGEDPVVAAPHRPGAVVTAVEAVYAHAAGLARRVPGEVPVSPARPARFARPGRTARTAVRLLTRSGSERPADGWIHADLHVHTSYSKDCRSAVAAVLQTAVDVGLDAIAIADHNTVSGALKARELAGDDLTVIVAEEVMTQQGEVIGLFLEKAIPAGLTFEATLSLIKEQGALVYVPHPFDRLHTTPSYRCLVDNLHRIDVIETYNARLAFSGFNANAERFAAKYNLAAGAGSDAHVLPGLGTAMLRMRPFRGPDDFLAALREVDIVTRRKSLFYLQSLKLLQNTLDLVLPGS